MTTIRIIGRDPSAPGAPYQAGVNDTVEVPGPLRILDSSYVSIQLRATDPLASLTDGRLYAKTVSGAVELFWIKDNGIVVQVTGVSSGSSAGIRYRIRTPISVEADSQYLVQGALIIEPGGSLAIAPDGMLVNLV